MDEYPAEKDSGGVWDNQELDFPHEPPFVCGNGYLKRYADRERQQGVGAYKDYHHAALRQDNN